MFLRVGIVFALAVFSAAWIAAHPTTEVDQFEAAAREYPDAVLAAKKAGLVFSTADLRFPAVPADQDAPTLYAQALKLSKKYPAWEEVSRTRPENGCSRVPEVEAMLRLLEEGAAKPSFTYSADPEEPRITNLFMGFSKIVNADSRDKDLFRNQRKGIEAFQYGMDIKAGFQYHRIKRALMSKAFWLASRGDGPRLQRELGLIWNLSQQQASGAHDESTLIFRETLSGTIFRDLERLLQAFGRDQRLLPLIRSSVTAMVDRGSFTDAEEIEFAKTVGDLIVHLKSAKDAAEFVRSTQDPDFPLKPPLKLAPMLIAKGYFCRLIQLHLRIWDLANQFPLSDPRFPKGFWAIFDVAKRGDETYALAREMIVEPLASAILRTQQYRAAVLNEVELLSVFDRQGTLPTSFIPPIADPSSGGRFVYTKTSSGFTLRPEDDETANHGLDTFKPFTYVAAGSF